MIRPVPLPARVHPPSAPDPADLALLAAPSSRRWRWALLGGGLLAAVGLGVWGWSGGRAPAWETTPLVRGDLVRRVTAVGQLEPVHSVQIGSDLNGTILEVLVDENEAVKAGRVLARLDPEPFALQVAQSRAAAAVSKANLAKARVDLERTEHERARAEQLLSQGAATAVEVDDARLAVAAAKATVAAAKASVDQASASLSKSQQDLADAAIRSPIDGVVLRRLIDPGQTVVSAMSATPLFEVASDLAVLQVDVAVDEADIGQVEVGQPARFTVSSWPDRVFDATVTTVDLAADTSSSVVVYGAELRVGNADGSLRPGMTSTAEIEVGKVDDVWLIPTLALRFRPSGIDAPDGEHVWTLQGGELVAVPVTIDGSDGAQTAVHGDGLAAGQAVVVGGGS